MVGVGQLDLAADLFQVVGGDRPFDGSLGAHVHEHRGLGGAVGADQLPPPGAAFCFQQVKHGSVLLFSK